MLPNSVEFFEAWAGANKAGASIVPVNWHLKTDELAYLLADSGARAARRARGPRASTSRRRSRRTPTVRVLVVGDGYEARGRGGARATTHRSTSSALARTGLLHVGHDRPAQGRRARTVVDAASAASQHGGPAPLWGWTSDDVYILSGPAYHAGPGGWTMAALYVGAPTVVLPTFDAREWLRLVDRHRVTCSFMVPAHFIRILEVPEDERAAFDLSSLRLIVHAGVRRARSP